MLGDDGCGAAMVHVHVRIFLELTQWFDPMVRNDEDIGVVVDVLQNHSQDFIETAVLVGESINRHGIDLRVVIHVVRLDGIKPVSYPVLAGLYEHGEVGRMLRKQIVEELGLLSADFLDSLEPLRNYFGFFSLQVIFRGHAQAVQRNIAYLGFNLRRQVFRIYRVAALDFRKLG